MGYLTTPGDHELPSGKPAIIDIAGEMTIENCQSPLVEAYRAGLYRLLDRHAAQRTVQRANAAGPAGTGRAQALRPPKVGPTRG